MVCGWLGWLELDDCIKSWYKYGTIDFRLTLELSDKSFLAKIVAVVKPISGFNNNNCVRK